MFNVNVSGFNTQEEAEAFVEWYSGSGEQEAAYWFEERVREGKIESSWMGVDSGETFPLTWTPDSDTIQMVIKPQ